jgi:hypothetical protein
VCASAGRTLFISLIAILYASASKATSSAGNVGIVMSISLYASPICQSPLPLRALSRAHAHAQHREPLGSAVLTRLLCVRPLQNATTLWRLWQAAHLCLHGLAHHWHFRPARVRHHQLAHLRPDNKPTLVSYALVKGTQRLASSPGSHSTPPNPNPNPPAPRITTDLRQAVVQGSLQGGRQETRDKRQETRAHTMLLRAPMTCVRDLPVILPYEF